MKNKKISTLMSLLISAVITCLVLTIIVVYKNWPNQEEYENDQAFLSEHFQTVLLAEPLEEIIYPVQSYVITTGGFCWLLAQSSIMSYLEPDIDFHTFVLHGNPTLFMAGRNEQERYGPALNGIHSFENLGYTFYRGSTSSIQPPRNVFPDIESENLIYFKNADEELLFVKKLLTVGIIPIVHIKGSFLPLIGYDDQGIWLANPESEDIALEDQPKDLLEVTVLNQTWYMSNDDFFDNWSGDDQFFWYEKTGPRITDAELYQENRTNALEAPENIETTIGILKNLDASQNISWIYTYDYDTPSTVALYYYFLNKGNKKLADKYLEIANFYDQARELRGPDLPLYGDEEYLAELLTEVLPLYKEAAALWP
ncbi:MAG: hypothetical protein ABIH67_00275 [Candidatus Uhrbacteria bacterium]